MRALGVALVGLLLVTVLAGCSSGDGDDASSSSTASGATTTGTGSRTTTTTGTGTSTTGPTGPANTPPTAKLEASATTGPAPLAVNFTVSGTDAEGGALTYSLAFGDASAPATGALPASPVAHTFASAGNFTVVLTVSDGKATNNATVTIAAVGAAAAGGVPPALTFTGTALGFCEPSNQVGACSSDDIEHKFTVTPAVKSITFALSWDVPGADLDLYINDGAGTERGSSASTNGPVADPSPVGAFRGPDEGTTVEDVTAADAGEWTAVIRPYEAPNANYTLTVTFA